MLTMGGGGSLERVRHISFSNDDLCPARSTDIFQS
jgi:hypothetical protein